MTDYDALAARNAGPGDHTMRFARLIPAGSEIGDRGSGDRVGDRGSITGIGDRDRGHRGSGSELVRSLSGMQALVPPPSAIDRTRPRVASAFDHVALAKVVRRNIQARHDRDGAGPHLIYNRRMWIQTLVNSRAFRIVDRSSTILNLLCFLLLTSQVAPKHRGVFGVMAALMAVSAAATCTRLAPRPARRGSRPAGTRVRPSRLKPARAVS